MVETTAKHSGKKLGSTSKFKGGPKPFRSRTVCDFWQWAYSDLMQNVERGVLAEYIVAVILGVDEQLRVPWLAYDLKMPNGMTVELKTMSRLQAWYQRELSNPQVVIKPTRKWDPTTNVMEGTPKLHSDIYVICFFAADSHDMADPLNLDQWKFFAFTKEQVKQLLQERKTISLKFLERSGIQPVSACKLKSKVVELHKH